MTEEYKNELRITEAKYRLEALNLAYGILLNKYQANMGKPVSSLTSVPTTDTVISEAERISAFILGK